MDENRLVPSQIDQDRFGIKIGKAYLTDESFVAPMVAEAKADSIRMIIARCNANSLNVADALEHHGFFLTDTLVYYSYPLEKKPIPPDKTSVLIRPVQKNEATIVSDLAGKTFKGYFGHYHADPNLDQEKCDEIYPDWSYNSCINKTESEEVFVADQDGQLLGFATMRINIPEEGEGVLFGVAPEAQGRGIYRSFILRGLEWCRQNKCTRMIVSTQITNIAVQKVWVRVGFEPSYAYYTFHGWIEP